tara:strand:- start:1116 stop:2114 length:999 start_codon:yes stop_codon:yes gene_type:complete
MNRLDEQYRGLLAELIYNGRHKEDRTGTGTFSLFAKQIRHKMADGFPLLTTKKMAVKTMMTELKWFLKGDTNIKYLVDNGCNIWNGDAYKKYKEEKGTLAMDMKAFINNIKTNEGFAENWGELGPIYGKQWRSWNDGCDIPIPIDQIEHLLTDIRLNPDSRRLMVSAWNVGDLAQMTLPPCHYGFQVYTRELLPNERTLEWTKSIGKSPSYGYKLSQEDLDEKGFPRRVISLMWNQRSVDTFLGLPFNIASYGALLCLIAKEVNMLPYELVGNLGDTHLYKDHYTQAKEQIERKPFDLPTIEFTNVDVLAGEFDYEVKDYECHPAIKAPLSN